MELLRQTFCDGLPDFLRRDAQTAGLCRRRQKGDVQHLRRTACLTDAVGVHDLDVGKFCVR